VPYLRQFAALEWQLVSTGRGPATGGTRGTTTCV